ncbi:MAG: hypothetical protein BWY83_00854 [bacterium ADurb.Bin478]|nr:MAG: hypothetical protein BWY83_00854 [bacterium ADurb.Bin478]
MLLKERLRPDLAGKGIPQLRRSAADAERTVGSMPGVGAIGNKIEIHVVDATVDIPERGIRRKIGRHTHFLQHVGDGFKFGIDIDRSFKPYVRHRKRFHSQRADLHGRLPAGSVCICTPLRLYLARACPLRIGQNDQGIAVGELDHQLGDQSGRVCIIVRIFAFHCQPIFPGLEPACDVKFKRLGGIGAGADKMIVYP